MAFSVEKSDHLYHFDARELLYLNPQTWTLEMGSRQILTKYRRWVFLRLEKQNFVEMPRA